MTVTTRTPSTRAVPGLAVSVDAGHSTDTTDTIALHGRADVENVVILADMLARLLVLHDTSVVVDLSDTEACGCSRCWSPRQRCRVPERSRPASHAPVAAGPARPRAREQRTGAHDRARRQPRTVSAADTRLCVACGRETTDRYFANAGSSGLGDDARSLPPPVPLCRTCKPIRGGDATSAAENTPDDAVVVASNGSAKPPNRSEP